MLTEVKAYSSWRSAPTLPLNGNRAETDLIQVRNITGLEPVKAAITTSPYGAVDGSSYTGGSVLSRNIVLTLHPNPDWDLWTYESLRKLLYSYFMPKRDTELVFYSDNMDPVKITGVVEAVTVNMFTKDPELQVSIICPDPYFTALNPKVITGQTYLYPGSWPPIGIIPSIPIEYNGTIETGMKVKVTSLGTPDPTKVAIIIGNPVITNFEVITPITSTSYFEMGSIPMKKYVQSVNIGTSVITNLLPKVNIRLGSIWPTFQPGENDFSVVTDQGVKDWELTFYERFGGL